MTARLSVCIIAKNEAGRIERTLQSVADVADQIIVVDSGSTDATVEIATRAGAQIVHHVWSDDFAAARNAAIPHINCKWVFWIDADEHLHPNSRDELRQLVQRDDALAATTVRRDYITGKGERQFAATHLLRLMRADCGIGWTGRCHEQPDPPVNELAEKLGLKLLPSRIVLDHDADYFGPGRIQKQKRNARLLEMEINERPDRIYYLIQCAAALQDLNDPRGAELMTKAVARLAAQQHEPKAPLPIAMLALEFAMLG
ncbi:MAG TPA: glycosyltransferase family 2 protein, partial [Tepidisphaeraceae bacterium]|nr:glycosyltransferase family 2 protein [Tepidisphaeraceae bacterium]